MLTGMYIKVVTLMNSRVIAALAGALLTLAFSTQSLAATDGREGNTSTGTIVIKLIINQGIQVANLQDVELEVDINSIDNDVVQTRQFCVRGNMDGRYTMTANSDGRGSSPFSIYNRQKESINFDLYFTGRLDSTVGEPLVPGVPSSTYEIESHGVNCDGQNNAELTIQIPASELQAARGAEYSGFLNLTIAAE